MFRSLLALAAIFTALPDVQAGQAIFTATGTLSGGSATSGAFVGQTVGSAVSLSFRVNTPGTVFSASTTNYVVDLSSFSLTIGTASTGLNTARRRSACATRIRPSTASSSIPTRSSVAATSASITAVATARCSTLRIR